MKRFIPALLSAMCWVTYSHSTFAVPSVGQLFMEQSERVPKIYLPSVGVRSQPEPPQVDASPDAPGIRILGFQYEGDFSEALDSVDQLLEPYKQTILTAEQIYLLPAWIDQSLAQLGYATRSQIPPQQVEQGILRVQIDRLTFEGVELEYGFVDQFNVPLETIERLVSHGQQVGQPLNIRDTERGQLVGIDLHGVSVSGGLQAQGETGRELALWVDNSEQLELDLGFTNRGNPAVGEETVELNLNYASPLGRGGSLYLNAAKTEELRYARLAYRTPVGNRGATADIQLGLLDYSDASTRLSSDSERGAAQHLGVGYRYPWIRQLHTNIYFTGTLYQRWFESDARSAGMNWSERSDYVTRTLELALDANHARPDRFWTYNLTFRYGDTDLSGSANETRDRIGARVAGSFATLSTKMRYVRSLSELTRLRVELSGQLSPGNLDDSERFYLGGLDRVRSYSTGEALGDQGAVLRLGLSHQWTPALRLTPFIDQGWIEQRVDNRDQSGAALVSNNHYFLQGIGLEARYSGPASSRLMLGWSRRVGSNPNSAAGGRDQSGEGDQDRFWINWRMPF